MPLDVGSMLDRAERGQYDLADVHDLMEEVLLQRVALAVALDDLEKAENMAAVRIGTLALVRRALGDA